MRQPRRILILGASYGSLLGVRAAMAGHRVTLVCLPAEIEAIEREGARVRFPIKGRDGLLEVDSRELPGRVDAAAPDDVDPAEFDLVALAMQEPQYGGVRALLDRVAQARAPCLSIMNMPPLPYLKRLPGVEADSLRDCYADASVWDRFEPGRVTLCSPDPQAFRPPGESPNVLQVRLPTNFKAARFESDRDTELLRQLEADIEAARLHGIALPVKLKVHDSIFVPLAKWAMLIAGNYRCVTAGGVRSIRDAVHGDVDAARAVYRWVVQLCVALGANEADLVPFEKYAAAAESLASPSSAARALAAGAVRIERVDRLVQALAAQRGMRLAALDETVALIDARLQQNRATAATAATAAPA
ncbi:MAG TPA: hypothetical protein VM491_09475 [Burkholderiaceae bacterium]|nr:hypothetical protein [Burkholderiaceae bacterium]